MITKNVHPVIKIGILIDVDSVLKHLVVVYYTNYSRDGRFLSYERKLANRFNILRYLTKGSKTLQIDFFRIL